MNDRFIMKAVIVLLVFPVVVSLLYTFIYFPLGSALCLVLAHCEHWIPVLTVTSLGVAALCSFALCRQLWGRASN